MKITTSILLLLLLCACDSNPTRSTKARQSVIDKYGDEVQVIPGEMFQFVVRTTNGEIWLVQCLNIGDERISAETKLFGASQK